MVVVTLLLQGCGGDGESSVPAPAVSVETDRALSAAASPSPLVTLPSDYVRSPCMQGVNDHIRNYTTGFLSEPKYELNEPDMTSGTPSGMSAIRTVVQNGLVTSQTVAVTGTVGPLSAAVPFEWITPTRVYSGTLPEDDFMVRSSGYLIDQTEFTETHTLINDQCDLSIPALASTYQKISLVGQKVKMVLPEGKNPWVFNVLSYDAVFSPGAEAYKLVRRTASQESILLTLSEPSAQPGPELFAEIAPGYRQSTWAGKTVYLPLSSGKSPAFVLNVKTGKLDAGYYFLKDTPLTADIPEEYQYNQTAFNDITAALTAR